MPGSLTTPGRPSACVGALGHIAFHYTDSVGTRNQFSIAAQWLACTFPYRRFADILTDACARLGADVGRCSFIAVDLHHLLLAGLPAHLCENSNDRAPVYKFQSIFGRFPPLQARRSEKVRFRCAVFRQFRSFHTAWVTSGKTPSEYIFSELPQVTDIARSAFSPCGKPPRIADHCVLGPSNSRGALTQQCHEIIQNRLALVREESVSVSHRQQPLPGQLGEPTHAHLHHRQ